MVKTYKKREADDKAWGEDLYILKAETGIIKVGRSWDVPGRLKAISKQCPLQVSIAATFPGKGALETLCHKALAPARLNGEWFRATVEEALTQLAPLLE